MTEIDPFTHPVFRLSSVEAWEQVVRFGGDRVRVMHGDGYRVESVAMGPPWPVEGGGVIFEGPWLMRDVRQGEPDRWCLSESI